MTSAEMISLFVERVKADARAGKRFSAFAPDDGMPRCFCDRCQRLANGFDGFGTNDRDPLPEASISNEWFHFVDAVLDAVNQEFPEHRIVTNGYANRDIPPELPHFNSRSNLVVMFANINACTLHGYDDEHCWQMQRQGQMVRGWTHLSDKVYLYGYNYTMLVSKFTLTPMVHRVRQNIPRLKQWGMLGFHDQDESDWALSGLPTRLVRAALEWDTNADVADVPAELVGKRVRLVAPALVNEAWVWVNGQYAGHRPYQMPWYRPHDVDLEITGLIRSGERNQITLRVFNNLDVFGASGIYERMFLYCR